MMFDHKNKPPVPTLRFAFYPVLFVLLLLLGFSGNAFAATINGGGNRSDGEQSSVTGALGQPDATPSMSGGTYAVKGDFWTQTTIVQVSPELIFSDSFETVVTQSFVPMNQFNIGDSIGEGEAAEGTIGSANHQTVWSTGYAGGDSVDAINERFEATDPTAYTENNSSRDGAFNQAISGSVMADFAPQAQAVANAASSLPDGSAGMVTVLLGNNDVCADTLADMTDPGLFESQYRAGLDVLASPVFNDMVNVHISGIPDIYWLWNAKRDSFWCRTFAWPFVPCQNLLANAADDCESSVSREDPDTVYAGDGANCQRRKAFHAEIRDTYNPILRDVLAEYQANNQLLNAEYVDVFDVRFISNHVNGGDCFHPSEAGHALMAEKAWCSSKWSAADQACSP